MILSFVVPEGPATSSVTPLLPLAGLVTDSVGFGWLSVIIWAFGLTISVLMGLLLWLLVFSGHCQLKRERPLYLDD